jgi:NAD(P)-dependent dehydrogenase (short-subunit alcohol dehydrogenase family)
MIDKIRLDGRTAVVTGGNSGIGLGIAQALAEAGAQVIVAGRREDANAAAVETITKAGGKAIAMRYDGAKEADADTLVTLAIKRFGGLDICVANAGGTVGGTAPLAQMTTEMWRGTVSLNLDAVFFLYRAAVRAMIAAGKGGSLIGISSVGSVRATPSLHYAAAKGGMNAMTMNLSVQLAKYAIRVNAILPGMIWTPALQEFLTTDSAREASAKRIPLLRIGEPEDVAGLALFLASDMSAYITGQEIVVDGAMTQMMPL